MKILYDHQIFSWQTYGGISRYFYELMKFYEKSNDIICDLALSLSENDYLNNGTLPIKIESGLSSEDFCFGLNFKGKSKIHRTLARIGFVKHSIITNRKLSIKKLKKGDFDVFHPTYYDTYFCEYINKKPFVLTVYDMIHELYAGRFFEKNDSTIEMKRYLIHKAEKIIAISENTKKDICDFYNVDDDKITVVYLGNSLNNPFQGSDSVVLPTDYILFVGERNTYKNFVFFLKSIASLLNKNRKLYLICGGSKPFISEELELIRDLNCENQVIHVSIGSDAILMQLYKNALAFVFPSLYEGFGIPILESFSCGCPAILSNVSSLPEIASSAAEYFNPEDETSILEAVSGVIYNNSKRMEMRTKGFERLNLFSWERTAEKTKKVYESVAKT